MGRSLSGHIGASRPRLPPFLAGRREHLARGIGVQGGHAEPNDEVRPHRKGGAAVTKPAAMMATLAQGVVAGRQESGNA